MNMNELCESIKFLCNSPQRLRILDALAERQMNVRDLMETVDSPRSTVQHNLMVLEDRGCIEKTRSGYTATTVGSLLHREFVTISETTVTIKRLAPFFEVVDEPLEIDIGKLTDGLVTTPNATHPDAPMKRLFEMFAGANRVHGFVPIVSYLVVELFHIANESGTTVHEYVLSQAAFDALRTQYDDSADRSGRTLPVRTTVLVYDGKIPYGLFFSDERLALAAYDTVGRMQVLVESTSEEAVEWGERIYGTYRSEATEPKTDISSVARGTEPMD